MFQLFTAMGRRNHFHIFLSLSVNRENELAKMLLFPEALIAKIYFIKISSCTQALDSLPPPGKIQNSLNGQNHSLTDFHHLMKKSLPSPKFPIPRLGDIPPTSLMLFGKLAFFTFQSRGVEVIFTHFFSFNVNWDSV